MNLFFSDRPGSHERHLRRKVNNPLFGDKLITQDEIMVARAKDEEELAAFMDEFHQLARDASGLDANVDAEILIDLKQRLEKNYEACCYVMGDVKEIQSALARLIESIMTALMHASQEDEHAHQKLVEEQAARTIHFGLLEHGLVADLIRAESPIQSEELVSTILSEQRTVVEAVMQLFTDDQLDFICSHAETMLDGVESDHARINSARNMLKVLLGARGGSRGDLGPAADEGLAS